jgi:hypothetical protein
MATRESTLDRIVKMLKQVEGTDNENEKMAFHKRAFAMAAKAEIDKAEIMRAMSEDQRKKEEPIAEAMLQFGRPYEQRLLLAYYVYDFCGCTAIKYLRKKGETAIRLHVFGFRSDMERATAMHAIISLQTENGAKVAARNRPSSERLSTFNRGYWQDYGIVIRNRLSASKEQAIANSDTPGTAIMLRDKKAIVHAEMELRMGKTKKSHNTRGARRGISGRVAGRRDAQKADLGLGRSVAAKQHKEIGK